MAIEVAIATGTAPTSTGTKSFEVSGFGTPQAAIVYMSRGLSGSEIVAQGYLSSGFTDGTNTFNNHVWLADNAATANTSRNANTSIVKRVTASGVTEIEGVFSTWTTNGITINFTTVLSAYFIQVILIKGCTNVKALSAQLTTTGVNDITTVGFKPNLVYSMGIGYNVATGNSVHTIFQLGAAHNNSSNVVTQGQVAFSSVDAVGSEVASVVTRDDSCAGQLHNGAQSWKGSIESFDSSGFSVNTGADSPGNDYVYFLALDTGDTDGVDISIIDSPTSTGTLNVTAPSFEPQLSTLFMGTAPTTNTIHTADPMAMAVGIFDGTVEACNGIDVDDAAGTTNTQSNYAAKAVQMYEFGGTTHDIMFEATLTGFDSLGYDLNFPTYVDGTVRKWLSVSIKAPATGGITIPVFMNHYRNQGIS